MNEVTIIKAAVMGHAVADALGVPVEFVSRKQIGECPVTDMLGYGVFDVPKGTWSDDTSMTLCTLSSITERGGIDPDHIMSAFRRWIEDGHMTPHGKAFDVGRTCLRAIMNYCRSGDFRHCGGGREYDNGNGSLMRILPVSLHNHLKKEDGSAALRNIHTVSALTHAHERSCMACGIYDIVARRLMETAKKEVVPEALAEACACYGDRGEAAHFDRLFSSDFSLVAMEDIRSSGYVVDTLEAAIWCLLTTDNYRECVLKAVNLGQDTDTVAAVAGGLAGILYGYDAIPTEWIESLVRGEEILAMCDSFHAALTDGGTMVSIE